MQRFSPSQIAPNSLSTPNLGAALSAAIADNKKLVVGELFTNGQPVALKMEGYVTTNGINVDDKFGAHTLGFSFNDAKELEAFQALYKFFDKAEGIDSNWGVQDMVKGDKIYLKLKVGKNGNYNAKSNLKQWNPKNPDNAPATRGQKVDVEADLKTYFSVEEKKCGFYLTVTNLLFDTSK